MVFSFHILKMINKWRIIAIIFMILFILENLLIAYGVYLNISEENKIMECYYEICKDYPSADYDSDYNLCYCYDYDMMGGLVIAKEVWMK